MDTVYYFIAAFGVSLMGSLPFGMINLNVMATAVHRGYGAAMYMATGAVITEGVQLFGVMYGYGFLANNPDFEFVLRAMALPVFIGMGIFFFLKKQKVRLDTQATQRPFLRGIVLAWLNVLVYPFWLLWMGWMDFPVERHMLWLPFILGAMVGAYATMLGFIKLGNLIASKSDTLTNHLNRIIGTIFLLLSCFEIYKWIR